MTTNVWWHISGRNLLSNREVGGICGLTCDNTTAETETHCEQNMDMIRVLLPVNRKTHIEAAGGLHIWHLVVAHSWTALLLRRQQFTQDSETLNWNRKCLVSSYIAWCEGSCWCCCCSCISCSWYSSCCCSSLCCCSCCCCSCSRWCRSISWTRFVKSITEQKLEYDNERWVQWKYCVWPVATENRYWEEIWINTMQANEEMKETKKLTCEVGRACAAMLAR